ncbi:MAG: glucose PTS transporter subunit IIA [Lachnospiraceae bacterium]|nr:glucose PTS transporter subunit IIA [Lachnospiraceae bacterium]
MENSKRTPLKIFSDIFASVAPVLAASGLVLALLTAGSYMLSYFHILDLSGNSTFQLVSLAFSLIFTLFPVFIAWSAARALKCNEAVAMIIGSLMVAPDLLAYMAGSGERITFLGIPVMRQTWMLGNASEWYSYSGTVIPALLAVLVLYLLERLLYVLFNEEVGAVAVPLISLLVMIPLTLCIIGPVGLFAGKGALFLYQKAEAASPIAGGALIGGLWSLLLLFGAQKSILPIAGNDLLTTGRQTLLGYAGAAIFAQAGAAMGVMIRTKNSKTRTTAGASLLAAVIGGVSDPASVGINLRFKRPMLAAVIAGAAGGAFMGYGGILGDQAVNYGLVSLFFTYSVDTIREFAFYAGGLAIAFFGAWLLSWLFNISEDEIDPDYDGEEEDAADLNEAEADDEEMAAEAAEVSEETAEAEAAPAVETIPAAAETAPVEEASAGPAAADDKTSAAGDKSGAEEPEKKADTVPVTETAVAAAAGAAGAAAAEGTDSGNREIPGEEEAEEDAEEEDDAPIVLDITAPMSGKVLPLSSVKDASFASGEIGKGVCIIPDNGDVFAPADGVVTMVYGPANHAIALKLEDSVDMLIHIGLGTAGLGGKYFQAFVSDGDTVSRGTSLLSADLDKLRAEGCDLSTPVVIGNPDLYTDISVKTGMTAGPETVIMTVTI